MTIVALSAAYGAAGSQIGPALAERLRVRLTGPVERRIEHAMRARGLDRDTTERTLRALDRTHADYLRQFYGVDILDPALYHLVVDATSFDAEVCVKLIATAAEALAMSEF